MRTAEDGRMRARSALCARGSNGAGVAAYAGIAKP